MKRLEKYKKINTKTHENLNRAIFAAYNYNLTEYLKILSLDDIMQIYGLIMYSDMEGIEINIYECINQEVLYRCMIGTGEKGSMTLADLENALYFGYLEYLLDILTDEKIYELKELVLSNDIIENVAILASVDNQLMERENNKQYKLEYVK